MEGRRNKKNINLKIKIINSGDLDQVYFKSRTRIYTFTSKWRYFIIWFNANYYKYGFYYQDSLPLLLNYGITDFWNFDKGIMRPLSLVPGSAINAIVSCSSLVSLSFATVVASFLKISHLFLSSVLAASESQKLWRFIIGSDHLHN